MSRRHAAYPAPDEQRQIAQALVDWFQAEGKDYPWRRTTEPWAILVSEVMLQQTSIPTVLGRYETWMRLFPTPADLAAATEQEALRSWEGMGYYRRVKALQAAARAIMEQHGGHFPQKAAEIRALPGIGDYTLGAVMSFAYNQPVPLVDANVSRVFARLCNDETPVDSPTGQRAQWKLASEMVHPQNPRAYNSALMELGQNICKSGEPNCLLCPLRAFCRAEDPASLPCKLPKKEFSALEHHDIWLLTEEGLLMERQEEGKRHAGLYRLPQRPAESCAALPLLERQKYSVTRYKVTRHLHDGRGCAPAASEEFIPLAQLAGLPIASPDRKIIRKRLPSRPRAEAKGE